VEVVAHPLQSKYMIGSSGAPNSIITAYASAAAAAAIPELLKQIETPCLKLCAFLATHCQVIWIVKRRMPMTLKPNPIRTAPAPPCAHRGTGGGPRPHVRGCCLSSRSVHALESATWMCEHGLAGVDRAGHRLVQHTCALCHCCHRSDHHHRHSLGASVSRQCHSYQTRLQILQVPCQPLLNRPLSRTNALLHSADGYTQGPAFIFECRRGVGRRRGLFFC
jgi:hypothetical protein